MEFIMAHAFEGDSGESGISNDAQSGVLENQAAFVSVVHSGVAGGAAAAGKGIQVDAGEATNLSHLGLFSIYDLDQRYHGSRELTTKMVSAAPTPRTMG
jgi:hypothetical protein